MKFKFYIAICVLITITFRHVSAQANYQSKIQRADASYQNGKYAEAALTYQQAFSTWPDSVRAFDVFNSARSWAAADRVDSAIVMLQSAAKTYKFSKYGILMVDPKLSPLHQRPEWQSIAEAVKHNMEDAYTPLQLELQAILNDDQKYRIRLDSIRKSEGETSADFAKVWVMISYADSINLVKVENILDKRGWPPYSEIGNSYAALFLVIQHADLNTQLKYLPMIQEAAKKNDVDPESLALLEDRVAVAQGKKQLYGSQVDYDKATHTYKVFPIEDEAHVNDRRASAGMAPLQDYLKQWGIVYLPVK